MLAIRQEPGMREEAGFVRIRCDHGHRLPTSGRNRVYALIDIRYEQDGSVAVPASTSFIRATGNYCNRRSSLCFNRFQFARSEEPKRPAVRRPEGMTRAFGSRQAARSMRIHGAGPKHGLPALVRRKESQGPPI